MRGAETLLEAVKNCWASLWTARAMAYRAHEGIDPATVSLAVVVQRMVEAEAAGTLFTADPVSGQRDRTIINAAWGLGEAVVGGQVTPDTLVLAKGGSGRVISRKTADKEVMTAYSGSGVEDRSVPEARRHQPVLDDEAAEELARYGARIEDHYGSPQDIEWARAGGEFFLLQARPITNLPSLPLGDIRWEPPVPGSAWWRRQVVENLPEPLSPLFEELYLREGLELSIDDLMAYFGMRLPARRGLHRPANVRHRQRLCLSASRLQAQVEHGPADPARNVRRVSDDVRGRDAGVLARASAARLPGQDRTVEVSRPGERPR